MKQKGRILIVGFAGTEGNIEKIGMNRVLLRQAQVIGYVSLPVEHILRILIQEAFRDDG